MANSLRSRLKKLNYQCKITDEELNELLDKLDGHGRELIKHGHWTYVDDNFNAYECSSCGEWWCLDDGTPKDNGMNYCPKCGAKMEADKC